MNGKCRLDDQLSYAILMALFLWHGEIPSVAAWRLGGIFVLDLAPELALEQVGVVDVDGFEQAEEVEHNGQAYGGFSGRQDDDEHSEDLPIE